MEDQVLPGLKNRKESVNFLRPDAGTFHGQRRPSRNLFGKAVKGITDLRRMTLYKSRSSVSDNVLKTKVAKENTYKMKPDPETVFSPSKVKEVVTKILESEVADMTYNQEDCSDLACVLAERINDKVKQLNFARYKLACNVIIGQLADQGMEVASRCCWDHNTDNFSCVTYKNKTMSVVALVFGVYYE